MLGVNAKLRLCSWMALVVGLAHGCGPGDTPGPGTGGAGGTTTSTASSMASDTDGDGISDADEGAAEGTDTDGDGTPDFKDTDSDGDGIDDSVEAGDGSPDTPPVDSDGDGTPDFQDLDSDDNKILDEDEGVEDRDNDTIGDYADLDNDGDLATDVEEITGAGMDCDGDGNPEATGDATAPADCDGDGTPNYNDEDSDGDTIRDKTEGAGTDTDADGALDRYDLDSDNDTITDAEEAGDADLSTPPIDTDMDMTPDYLDADSDQDGLSDEKEKAAGTDPKKQDTDGDGVSDLIEFAAGTDPNDAKDNPQAQGNFVFVVPYEETTTPPDDTLEFRTSVQFADLYFLFDETGSMGAEFTAMKNPSTGVPKIIADLTCTDTNVACIVDGDCNSGEICFLGTNTCVEDPIIANNGDGCIPDLWTGVGRFNECNTYTNTQHLQDNATTTANKIGSLGPGADEAVYQSAACVANKAYCSNNPGCSADASITNPVGCPGFRDDAVRVLVHITDAGNQGSSCMSNASIAGNAMKNADNPMQLSGIGIKYIGLYGTGDPTGDPCGSAQACTSDLGIASGTLDLNNNNQPFIYSALNSAVTAAAKKAVLDIVRGVPLNVTIKATDEKNDAGDALQFLDYLEVNVSGQGSCSMVSPTADTDNDQKDDAFPELLGGTPVCWNVHPVDKQSTAMPTTEPQLFKAKLTVSGDGSPLDSRAVFFLVPPKEPEVPQGPK